MFKARYSDAGRKNLVICFPSGTLVIVDWNNVNYLRKDRYKPTAHQEDFNRLGVTTQGRYFIAVPWQPAGNQLETSCQPTANQSSAIPQPQPNVTQPNVTLEREVKRESAVVNQEPEPINHSKRTAAPANLEYLPEGTESLDEAATEALRKSCLAQIESATAKAPPPEVDAETAELKRHSGRVPDRNRTPHPLNDHSPRRAEPVSDHPAHAGNIARPHNERSLEPCFFTPCMPSPANR